MTEINMEKFKNVEKIQGGERDNQVLYDMTDVRSAHPYFVDLRRLMDDKTVLKNPHKGWFWHYVDNGFSRSAYRNGYTPEDLRDFPGMNHLYLRFDWTDVEKEKGVYDFSCLDEIMETWGKEGYTFSLRVVTYEAGPLATPAYVFDEGAHGFLVNGKALQPDYNDPIFLHYLEKFLAALGAKYNGDPRIELIDVGTYGTWGEGHSIFGDWEAPDHEVMKKHYDLHAKYFPDTIILCNDDSIMSCMAKGKDKVRQLAEYADARGFGLQDDSIFVLCYCQDCGYSTVRAPWLFDRLYENAPACIELDHYTSVKENSWDNFRDGFAVIEALKNSHATFAGFHGYPKEWLAEQRHLTEYAANRLGYWYFVNSAIVPPLTDTAHNKVTLEIENRGWAPAYHPYQMKVMLRTADGKEYVQDVDCDNRLWKDGTVNHVSLRLDLRGIPSGEYAFAIGLFDGNRPVRFALSEKLYHQGFYTLCQTSVKKV